AIRLRRVGAGPLTSGDAVQYGRFLQRAICEKIISTLQRTRVSTARRTIKDIVLQFPAALDAIVSTTRKPRHAKSAHRYIIGITDDSLHISARIEHHVPIGRAPLAHQAILERGVAIEVVGHEVTVLLQDELRL